MIKWEYKKVYIDKTLKNLNRMGSDGWELCYVGKETTIKELRPHKYTELLFKRVIPEVNESG